MLEWANPATTALNEIRNAAIVRFSVLALSSIFFLVDPFAAIPSFLRSPTAWMQRAANGWRERLRSHASSCSPASRWRGR